MRWKCALASPWDGALHLACQASRLLPSVANVRRRGRHSNDCPVFDGGGYLDVLSTQSILRSESSVLCSGCLTQKGPDQPSDTAIHRSRCHSMFAARVVQWVPWCNALTSTWSQGLHRDPSSEPRSLTISLPIFPLARRGYCRRLNTSRIPDRSIFAACSNVSCSHRLDFNNLTFSCLTASASCDMCQFNIRLTDSSACGSLATSQIRQAYISPKRSRLSLLLRYSRTRVVCQ